MKNLNNFDKILKKMHLTLKNSEFVNDIVLKFFYIFGKKNQVSVFYIITRYIKSVKSLAPLLTSIIRWKFGKTAQHEFNLFFKGPLLVRNYLNPVGRRARGTLFGTFKISSGKMNFVTDH